MGQSCKIALPDIGVFEGTVRWQGNGRIGIQLNSAIDLGAIRFDGGPIEPKADAHYKVAPHFQPTPTTWRPGFGRKI